MRNLLNRELGSIAQSLSLSSAHRPDMTEILLNDVKSQKLICVPSLESVRRNGSNEGSQQRFSSRSKKLLLK